MTPAQGVSPAGGSGEPPRVPRVPRVRTLHVYPLKSAAGISVEAAEVDEVGLAVDRRWMVVGADGRFMSQRTHPRMALLETELTSSALRVAFRDRSTLELPRNEDGQGKDAGPASLVSVRVWFEDRYGIDCGDDAAAWMSETLQAPCRVLRAGMPPDGSRLSAEGRVRSSFADARPALVISTASLEDLNARLGARGFPALPMNRFRPNIVVDGIGPYEEDAWGSVRFGDVPVRGVNPCPRCATTTVDQATGVAVGPEPLRTLASYRRMDDGSAAFGMNVAFGGTGLLRVGDEITG